MTFRAFINSVFPKLIYNQTSLNVTPLAKTGAATLTAGAIAKTVLTDDQKSGLIDFYQTIFKKCVDFQHVSDLEIRQEVWANYQCARNVIVTSPLFYAAFNMIQKSGLPLKHHLMRASIRGFTGTAGAALPAMAMYTIAAALLPATKEAFMRNGSSDKAAKGLAQATVLVGLASPIELLVESIGCGLSLSQMRFGVGSLLTGFLAGRLITGVLSQRVNLDEEGKAELTALDVSAKILYSSAGTTLFQGLINAGMMAQMQGVGARGILNYALKGTLDKSGSSRLALQEWLKTFGQRVSFVSAWTMVNLQEESEPHWVNPHGSYSKRVIMNNE